MLIISEWPGNEAVLGISEWCGNETRQNWIVHREDGYLLATVHDV